MPGPIIAILDKIRQDLAEVLSPDSIRAACRDADYRWRERLLDPVATVSLFLLQVLNGNTACRHVVHFGDFVFSASAYCRARIRLPLLVLQKLAEMIAAPRDGAGAAGANWRGHRVWIEDGSSFSMSDVPALRDHFGQPTGQRPGCGFPVAKWVALFDLATGMLVRSSVGPMRAHDMSKAREVESEVGRGDVVLGDRGFCSYAHIAALAQLGVHAVFRLHQKQLVDFTPGRPLPTKLSWKANPEGLPHSLWVRSNGKNDQVVVWFKPKRKPRWMSAEAFAALPAEVAVRELRYEVARKGFRVKAVTLVTTPIDADAYPAAELAELYRRRWQVELNFRHIKISMKMDILRSKTVVGILKELTVFSIAYNMIRSVMLDSSRARGVATDRIGFVDALRWLIGTATRGDLGRILVIPSRPDRVDPRVRKRRPKQYPLMKEPRSVLRNRLMGMEVAA
jgi:hypothetical protein